MIDLLTAVEIFSNPHDLQVSIVQDKNIKKWALLICRGPGHGFKTLLESQFFFDNSKDAIGYVKKILDAIQKNIREGFLKKESLVFQALNPKSEKLDEASILNDNVITHIIKDLEEKEFSSTFENKKI